MKTFIRQTLTDLIQTPSSKVKEEIISERMMKRLLIVEVFQFFVEFLVE